jgi:hypothetical protein
MARMHVCVSLPWKNIFMAALLFNETTPTNKGCKIKYMLSLAELNPLSANFDISYISDKTLAKNTKCTIQ